MFSLSINLWKVDVSFEPDRVDLDEGGGWVVLLGVDGHSHRGGRLVPVVPTLHYTLYNTTKQLSLDSLH